MHAVLVAVKIKDDAAAHEMLRGQVVPQVSSSPGFVSGVWLEPQNGMAYSTVVFESEEAARAASEQIAIADDAPVELGHVSVVEVAAYA